MPFTLLVVFLCDSLCPWCLCVERLLLKRRFLERRYYRSPLRSSLPRSFFGKSVRNSTHRGYLYGASRVFTKSFNSAASDSVGSTPSARTTNAFGFINCCSSLAPMTAHSRTASCSSRQFSISVVDTKMPPTFYISSVRPRYQK